MKKLGVIILNYNGLKLLQEYIPAAVRYTQCDDADLIVADNGSDDGSLEWLRDNYPQVRIIALDRNYGFAEGYNRAIAECHNDYRYVTLLNSDVEVTKGWWLPLVSFLEENPQAGAVQPKIKSARNHRMYEYAGAAGGFIDALGYPYCRGRLFDYVEEDNGQYDTPPLAVAWASGACLTMPVQLYLDLGGLDAKFVAHMEEIDLCWRSIRAGHPVYAISNSEVYHLGGATLSHDNPHKTYLNFRNNLLLLHKNLPRRRGKRITFVRRLADSLAFLMFLLKGELGNAKALLRAHRDFSRMRRLYTDLPSDDSFADLPGTSRYAVIARQVLRKKSLNPYN